MLICCICNVCKSKNPICRPCADIYERGLIPSYLYPINKALHKSKNYKNPNKPRMSDKTRMHPVPYK